MKCKCITNNQKRKSNHVEASEEIIYEKTIELQASLSFSAIALYNYISVEPYKSRLLCNILGTALIYTEVLGKAKFSGTDTKF